MAKQSILANEKLGAFLCVRDRAKARAFFCETLGLTLTYEDDYALVFDANGTTLRISPVRDLTPQPFTVLGWEVSDIGSNAKVAWLKDPDGNILSLAQQ